MTIGVFARRARLSPKALRLYDRDGLLVPAQVDRFSGYRHYTADQLDTARLISRLRRLGMPLDEVAAVVAVPDPRDRADRIAAWWSGVEADTAARRSLARYLTDTLRGERSTTVTNIQEREWQVQEREVGDQLVLTEQRHTTVDGLSAWIGEGLGRLMRSAGTTGPGDEGAGASGAPFVIYHGEVTEDSDGPVEVCLPVDAAPPGVASRVEPAHREAFVRLTRGEVEFPQILGAYDRVDGWIRAQGHTPVGPPREIYFTDFMGAAPGDEVCDVAWPFR
ncbi:MerR family transcriptional regulator [Nakamurella sp. YIM 132087]|uniref:MerR family transcriptional regulator n=2 Tax=Nakamurella alba TaxID=2665158 RepID=A0A7K1FMG2_9ACTN|nr:MerR family transcriptional regulator [Nakamurella alba]